MIFKKKYGYSPCLVIDGVDLIAKTDSTVFVYLIDRAKYLANEKVLHIVLVSSEDNVLPLLDSTSSKTRITYVEEVMDISENEAKAFLMTEMAEDVAQKVVSISGGRIIHLIQALTIHMQEKDCINRQYLPDVIVGGLMSRCIQSSLTDIMKQPTCNRGKNNKTSSSPGNYLPMGGVRYTIIGCCLWRAAKRKRCESC